MYVPAYWRCGGYPTNSMCVLGGCVTRMKRVWFSREGVTQTLEARECAAQSSSVRHTRVPVTIFRTGMQAYYGRRRHADIRTGQEDREISRDITFLLI